MIEALLSGIAAFCGAFAAVYFQKPKKQTPYVAVTYKDEPQTVESPTPKAAVYSRNDEVIADEEENKKNREETTRTR